MTSDNNLFNQYAELVNRFKSGDKSAFTEIYENSRKMVYVTCLGILNNEQDAEDAMQETYITVYEKIGTLDNDNTFLTWLKTIAANKARDKFKSKKNNASYEDVLATEEYVEGDDNLENLPDSLILEKDKRDTFYKIMRKELSDEQFQTTLLYYYDELPVAKIAQIMDCPENTVKSKLRLARIKIKSGIEEYERKNNISILGAAAGTGSLGTFFNAFYGSVNVPAVKGLPVKVGAGAKSAAGKAAGNAAKTAAKTGAKVGHTAAGAGAKAAATSSIPKVFAIVSASVLGVSAIGGAILVVHELNKDEDEEDNSAYEIEYDGLYCNIDKADEITKCLRFYSDGKVISTDYEYNSDSYFPEGTWFNLDSGDNRVEEGTYKVDGSKIKVSFEDEYNGYVMKESVYIDDTKYKYYEFDDINGYIPEADTSSSHSDPDGTGTTDPVDPTEPTDTTMPVTPISGAYLDILYRYQTEILDYEAAFECYSTDYIDITDDDINDLMFLYCPNGDASHVRLAIYSYDSSTDTAVCLLDRNVSEGGEFCGAALLDNGNLLYYRYYEYFVEDVEYGDGHLYEVELNGADGIVLDEWSFDQGYNSYHNGEFVGAGYVYDEAFQEYRSQVVLPIMPHRWMIENFEDPSYDSEFSIMTKEVYDAGDYHYYADLVALLGGNAGTASDTTPVVSFTADMKNAYLDLVNSITIDDFTNGDGVTLDADEIYFDLVYINDDDIPELICCCSEYSDEMHSRGNITYANIYTYTDGEVILLYQGLTVDGVEQSYYYPRENAISCYSSTSGMYSHGLVLCYTINYECTELVSTGIYAYGNVMIDESSDRHDVVYDDSGIEHYFITDYSAEYWYKEISEEDFLAITTGTGEAQSLVATKTAEEITVELS